MSGSDTGFAVTLEKFLNLYRQHLIDESELRVVLRGLGLSAEEIRHIERQYIIQGDYLEQHVASSAPTLPPAYDVDKEVAHYLRHVIDSNRRLHLQGIRSSSGLVSIELEEIYITLTANGRRMAIDDQQWVEEMGQLAPGEAQRFTRDTDRLPEVLQQSKVNVHEALHDHMRLVVLGDPGSGKTTLLKFLALTFARDPNGETGLVAARLRLDEARLPILLPLRDFAKHLQENYKDSSTDGAKLLLNFFNICFENQDIHIPSGFFADKLQQGSCAVLLDGMDEVADLASRYRIARIIERFTIAYPANRYVVTSRLVGYAGAARLGENYFVTTICDFTWADIERFLAYWNRSIEITVAGEETPQTVFAAKKQTEALLRAIETNERVRDLAVNPLMLTVIALVQRYRAQLPERRAELYEEAIEVLLSHWDTAKGLSAVLIIAGRELDASDRRSLLEPISLWMMEHHTREIEASELCRQLGQQFHKLLGDQYAADKAADTFLQLIRERSGLLIERGQNIYAFSHLTFQEYLAARAIAGRNDYISYTLMRMADSWWREVVLLEVGSLSVQSGRERLAGLLRAIMNQQDEPKPCYNLVLAADCLTDVGPARVESDIFVELQRRLHQEFERPIRISYKMFGVLGLARTDGDRRAAAADALGRIEGNAGMLPDFWRLPYGEPVWVNVPEGDFIMGGLGKYDGKPVHRIGLEAYKIAKIPITNAQYRFFVEAVHYAPPDHWENGRIPRGYESHPVVNVSWYDALKYCAWLSSITGESIALPSEAQWEKAARGYRDQRAYPWGERWDVAKCNNWELGLNGTTPVGIFPKGASPYGCLDMGGNVWEWTTTIWGPWDKSKLTASHSYPYPYDPTDGREDLNADDNVSRVLRGGAFSSRRNLVRCAFHYRNRPFNRIGFIGFRVVSVQSTLQNDEITKS